MKPVTFTPANFGGYTFFLILSGLTFELSIVRALMSLIFFFMAMYFYNESTPDDIVEEIKIEE